MIRAVEKEELEQCIQIFHRGYGTVADEFGLTEENSPDRGRAALPCSRLQEEGGAIREKENCFGYDRR